MNLMDPMINQAVEYLDRFGGSKVLLIHLNWGPIKKKRA